MAATDDLILVVTKRLDDLISREKDSFVAVDAARHERLAGRIQGLTQARDEIKSEARKFRLRDDEDDAGDALVN